MARQLDIRPRVQEALVLDLLQSAETVTLEQATESLPELSWSELFHAVDTLSRSGAIMLQRRGFTYVLASLRGHRASTELAS